MAKFKFQKYNAYLYKETLTTDFYRTGNGAISGSYGYTFDRQTGIFALTGGHGQVPGGSPPTNTMYALENNVLEVRRGIMQDSWQSTFYRAEYAPTKYGTASIVVGTDNEYPLNGIHTDDYWYIRTLELVSTATPTAPSGGQTIDDAYTITWTRTSTDTTTDVELSFDNGATWKRIGTELTGTTLVYDWANEPETSLGRIRTRAVKGDAVSEWKLNAGVFTIFHAFAPSQPTNLNPSGAILDRTLVIRMSWQHNHPNPQSRFVLQHSLNQSTWTTIDKTTPNQYYDFAANTFTEAVRYWRVKTYSDRGLESPYSNTVQFMPVTPTDAPIILTNATQNIARPVLEWSQSNQIAYQVVILNSISVIVWDSGQVVSGNKAVTCGVDLLDGATYTFKVRTKSTGNIWTDYSELELYITYIEPEVPTLSVEPDAYGPAMIIEIINPLATGDIPETAYNDIYRDGVRIATNITPNTKYYDYAVASGVEYQYQAVAVSVSGSISGSVFVTNSISLECSIINKLDGEYVKLRTDPVREKTKEYLGGKIYFAGREKPVMQFEEFENSILNLSFVLYNREEFDMLKEIVSRKETVLYRDNRGRKIYGIIRRLSESDVINDVNWFGVNFAIEEVDYSEVV